MELDWAGIQAAIRAAINMDLLTRNDGQQYEAYLRFKVSHHMENTGLLQPTSPSAGGAPQKPESEFVQEFLDEKLTLRPRMVMATLSQLGIVKVSPVWKDFMKDHERRPFGTGKRR